MTRRLIHALAGLLTLAAGLVGLPAFLLAAAHQMGEFLPAAAELPAALLAPGDGGLFLAFLLAVGWVCWAVFVLSFAVEVVARARGVRTPHLGRFVPQHTTAWAITAILAAAATLATTSAPAEAAVSTAAAAPAAAAATQSARVANQPVRQHLTDYRVRSGDTLWDIADEKLDNPSKWPAIADASREVDQPNGQHLTDPDLILPGWTLHIPATEPRSTPSPTGHGHEGQPQRDDGSARLPSTPLRPAAAPGHSEPASTVGSTSKLPGTPLRPLASNTTERSAAHRVDALPSTPLRPTPPPAEGQLTASEFELPVWVAHPLQPVSWQEGPSATRCLALAAMAARRGLTWP